MKKLIAILVVFAVVAGAAFAADIGAGGNAKVTLLKGNSVDEDIGTAFGGGGWLNASANNDDNTMGGKFSFWNNGQGGADSSWFYFWWAPIEQLFVKAGKVGEDGKYWAGSGIVGWDLQSNDLFMSPAFGWYNGFAGGILGDSIGFFSNGLEDYGGLQISIIPVYGFTLNLGFNFNKGTAESVYLDNLAAQIVWDIAGVGQTAVGFRNGPEGADKHINFQWKMNLTSAMKLELGVHFPVAPENGTQNPLDIGFGFGYGNPWGDTFWLNARVGAAIPMAEEGGDTRIGVDIVPSYDLGIFRVYVPIGVAFILPKEGDAILAWSFNPYIRKQLGNFALWAGLQLFNGSYGGGVDGDWSAPANTVVRDKESSEKVNWAVPIALHWAW